MKREDFEILIKVYKSGRHTYIVKRKYLFGLIKIVENYDDSWWYGGGKKAYQFTCIEGAENHIKNKIESYFDTKVQSIRVVVL